MTDPDVEKVWRAGYKAGMLEAAEIALRKIFDTPHDPGVQIATAICAKIEEKQ